MRWPDELMGGEELLIAGGHRRRLSSTAALIFLFFIIRVSIVPTYSSHVVQPFDVDVAKPPKTAFR
jgi:hypothetical protein